MKLTLLEKLLASARTSAATAVVTHLVTGAQALVSKSGSDGELTLTPDELARALQLLDDDRSGTLETAVGLLFVEIWNPKPRLLVIGAAAGSFTSDTSTVGAPHRCVTPSSPKSCQTRGGSTFGRQT